MILETEYMEDAYSRDNRFILVAVRILSVGSTYQHIKQLLNASRCFHLVKCALPRDGAIAKKSQKVVNRASKIVPRPYHKLL